jgi:hypothetical protein
MSAVTTENRSIITQKLHQYNRLPIIGQGGIMAWDAVTQYKLLLEINNAIVKETTRSGLFKRLAAETRRIFPFDRFSNHLYHPETETLRPYIPQLSKHSGTGSADFQTNPAGMWVQEPWKSRMASLRT